MDVTNVVCNSSIKEIWRRLLYCIVDTLV